jgi:hypothetical protein
MIGSIVYNTLCNLIVVRSVRRPFHPDTPADFPHKNYLVHEAHFNQLIHEESEGVLFSEPIVIDDQHIEDFTGERQ